MAFDALKVIPLDQAFEVVFNILKTNKLSTRDESMLEALILSCPKITDGATSYILQDDLNNFCRNFIRSLRENDGSFLYKEKGYKGRLVDVEEFLESKEYMNQKGSVRPLVKYEMQRIVEGLDNIREVVLSGSVGWGKSYLSRMLMCYMLYRLSMLHNPQYQFELSPGSSIVMILQSVSLRLSKKILFDPLLSAVSSSSYFIKNFPFNKQVTSELQFPKQVYVLPVSGSEMATLGLDVYMGVVSELNYFSVVENSRQMVMRGQEETTYDQASNVYTNLIQRLKSRFQQYGKIPGCLVLDSAVHYPGDFLSKKIEEAKWDNQIHVVKHAIWDTLSVDRFSGKKFLVEIGTLDRSSRIIESREQALPEADVLEVPEEYRSDFDRDIETALRDFAGLATGHRRSFMPFKESIVDAYTVYDAIYNGKTLFKDDSIVINDYFVGPYEWDLLVNKEYLKQIAFNAQSEFSMHVDLGVSKDCVGLAIGHIQDYKSLPSTSFFSKDSNDFKEVLDMDAPVICIDGMLQIRPPVGGEVDFDMLRGFMFYLCDLLNIKFATMDTYQNVSFIQGLRKMKVRSGPLSTVSTPVPFMELKSSYIEGRIIHQKHDIYIDELLFLEYDPKKQRIDHLPNKCFTGDTRVALLDGTNPTFEELAQRYPNGEIFYVYSMTEDGIVIGEGRNSRKTGKDSPLMEVTLDNFQTIRCTPDHLFMTTSLEWIKAKDLRPEISIMPLYRNVNFAGGWGGYISVYDPIKKINDFVHKIVARQFYGEISEGYVVHHRDNTKINNHPDNLAVMSKNEHTSLHSFYLYQDKEYVKKLRAGHKKYRDNGGNEKSRVNMNRLYKEGILKLGRDKCKENGCLLLCNAQGYCDKHFQYYKRRGELGEICKIAGCYSFAEKGKGLCKKHLMTAGQICIVEECNNDVYNKGLCKWHYSQQPKGKIHTHKLYKNHKIICVKELDYTADVWDIEVKDYHNFALADGIFVHNSKDIADCVAGVVHILTHKVANYRRTRKTAAVPSHRQIVINKI
jgi:hypothetical protein